MKNFKTEPVKKLVHPTYAIFAMSPETELTFPVEQRKSIETTYLRLQRQGYGRYTIRKSGAVCTIRKKSIPLTDSECQDIETFVREEANEIANMGDISLDLDAWVDLAETLHIEGEARFSWKYSSGFDSLDRDVEPSPDTCELTEISFEGEALVWIDGCLITKQKIKF
jgi:hypothetical protein